MLLLQITQMTSSLLVEINIPGILEVTNRFVIATTSTTTSSISLIINNLLHITRPFKGIPLL